MPSSKQEKKIKMGEEGEAMALVGVIDPNY